MIRFIYIFIAFTAYYSNLKAQEIPKVEMIHINAYHLVIKDPFFLAGLDSLIFNSGCPEIIDGKAKIFNVYCEKYNQEDSVYKLKIILDYTIQMPFEDTFIGYFEYKDYLFLWFNDIPDELISISNKKRKLKYITGIHIPTDLGDFILKYSFKKLEVIDILCDNVNTIDTVTPIITDLADASFKYSHNKLELIDFNCGY